MLNKEAMFVANTEHEASIGENIRRLRKAAGMTQRELATRIGKSFSLIQKYEMGIVIPPITVIRKMADALNVDYFEIIGWNEMPGDDNATLITRDANDEDPARLVTTEPEYAMLKAYRAADDRAREDALTILQAHKK